MGTTLRSTAHRPAYVSALVLNPLIRLLTEVIFFRADHKLWSKTSITRWANAISGQQPYNLQEQWGSPKGNERSSGLCVTNNEVFTKRKYETRGEGNVMMQPWCYQVIGVKWEGDSGEGEQCAIRMEEDVISEGFRHLYSLPDEHHIVTKCSHCQRYGTSKSVFSHHTSTTGR